MKTCPQIAKILGISDQRLRYQLLNHPDAPKSHLRIKARTKIRYYDLEEVREWYKNVKGYGLK